jgi:hypothetical protein
MITYLNDDPGASEKHQRTTPWSHI